MDLGIVPYYIKVSFIFPKDKLGLSIIDPYTQGIFLTAKGIRGALEETPPSNSLI